MSLRMMGALVGWWVYELTGDPFAIGLVGLSEVIPALSMALYSGHVIDISEKRKLLLKCVFFYICTAGALLFLSTKVPNAELAERLRTFPSTGSSNRIARALVLEEPPSLDAGEMTDKGSINQRAVLKRRAALVDELYSNSERVLWT